MVDNEDHDSTQSGYFTAVSENGREIVVLDSATFVGRYLAAAGILPDTRVLVTASYAGVYCAKLIERARPLGVIGLDCQIGKDGAGIAGLWYFEALGVPAAATGVDDVELGNGDDLWRCGVISRVNDIARSIGVIPGQSAAEAALLLLHATLPPQAADSENREVVWQGPSGHDVIATNSIAEALPEDYDTNVLCTAGHTGRSVIGYIVGFRPYGFICSDGGVGKNNSGLAALGPANDAGIPGASVSALSARMGDGHSTYYDGVISTANDLAQAAGVRIGMPAAQAARLLAERDAH